MNTFRVAQLLWDVRSSLFLRPFVVILLLSAAAEVLPVLEARGILALPGPLAVWFATEPGSAQVVLATLAGSMMTVVSVVYTLLVVALTLASMQFSPRILSTFLRNASTQWTLGLVAGTFAFCVLVLRAVRVEPPFVPTGSLALAVGLVLASLGALVWFVAHIAKGIQANHLVDRLAQETERVIDEVWQASPVPSAALPALPGTAVLADRSGYVQLIDVAALRALAGQGRTVVCERGMGRFVAEGTVLARVEPCSAEAAGAVRSAFDLGPIRTMQDDVEWGFRQIIDIALKAISPAVNDPSTAATCIDQLTRLLRRALQRHPPAAVERVGTGVLVLQQVSAVDLVDLSFEQLRQYSRTDMAVSLRLVRALGEVADATADPAVHARLRAHARLLEGPVRAHFPEADCDELDRRLVSLRATARETPPAAAV